MSLLTACLVGACLGIWLDIAIQRWGSALRSSYIGRGVAAVSEYLYGCMVLAWELVRFDLPDAVRRRLGDGNQ